MTLLLWPSGRATGEAATRLLVANHAATTMFVNDHILAVDECHALAWHEIEGLESSIPALSVEIAPVITREYLL
jgi:hypothetical protein